MTNHGTSDVEYYWEQLDKMQRSACPRMLYQTALADLSLVSL